MTMFVQIVWSTTWKLVLVARGLWPGSCGSEETFPLVCWIDCPLAELQTLRCPAAHTHKSTLQRVIGCSRCCALHTYLFSSLRLESCHGLYCRRANRSDPHRYAGPCSCCSGPLQSCSLDIDMARNSNRELYGWPTADRWALYFQCLPLFLFSFEELYMFTGSIRSEWCPVGRGNFLLTMINILAEEREKKANRTYCCNQMNETVSAITAAPTITVRLIIM